MLAERDYEIRNRTVHTKEGFDELGPLLPFNLEVETPEHDTALVRFLAQETPSGLRASTGVPAVVSASVTLPCRETHRSGSSTRPSERLTVPAPGSPLRRSANAAS